MRTVPFYDYTHTFVSNEGPIVDIVKDVGRRGAFIMQRDLLEFEEAVAQYMGAKRVVGVGNATDAMEMALAHYGVGPGDEVLVSAHTMIATASAVATVGARVVPVDIAADGLMDIESCRQRITANSKAILITQLNGQTADMDPFLELAEDHKLMLFEDSAQALGSRYRGQAAGTFGLAGCLSFYPAKILGSLGDGGAIVCNDESAYEDYLMMRDHGRTKNGDVALWGRNSRLDNLQAAVLHYFLRNFETVVSRRRELAAIYDDRLGHLDQLVLPRAPSSGGDFFDAFQNYELRAKRRDELKDFLRDQGIGTLIQWGGKGIHQFPRLGIAEPLRNADVFFQECLMLPLNTSLGDEDVEYVCDRICHFYAQHHG